MRCGKVRWHSCASSTLRGIVTIGLERDRNLETLASQLAAEHFPAVDEPVDGYQNELSGVKALDEILQLERIAKHIPLTRTAQESCPRARHSKAAAKH